MGDLKRPAVIWLKGALFVLLGVLAAGLLIGRHPSLATAALLAICIWAFCRAYYFVFYVIQHYTDPEYRYAGLIDFAKYAWHRRRN